MGEKLYYRKELGAYDEIKNKEIQKTLTSRSSIFLN